MDRSTELLSSDSWPTGTQALEREALPTRGWLKQHQRPPCWSPGRGDSSRGTRVSPLAVHLDPSPAVQRLPLSRCSRSPAHLYVAPLSSG